MTQFVAPPGGSRVRYKHTVCMKQQTGRLIRAATTSRWINESIRRKKMSPATSGVKQNAATLHLTLYHYISWQEQMRTWFTFLNELLL